jgi:biotin synthase-like enzyme
MEKILEKAKRAYLNNFGNKTCFERAIFFSWHCNIRDCAYCYMSTQPEKKSNVAKRTTESILAEIILCRNLGWRFGFLSGGVGAYSVEGFEELLEKIYLVHGEKFWINVGALSKEDLKRYSPYLKGVVGSIETINEEIHRKVCPSKPIQPYVKMFREAKKLGLQNAMTIIIGLGETIDDFPKLEKFVEENSISKIHIYGLNPQKGTIFEDAEPPLKEYQAEWIARTRIAFPEMDIQCGIWADRTDYVATLLRAGANSISKFPAIRYFGKKEAKAVEEGAEKAGRRFIGTLTKLLEIDWDREVDRLGLERALKEKIKVKLRTYLRKM